MKVTVTFDVEMHSFAADRDALIKELADLRESVLDADGVVEVSQIRMVTDYRVPRGASNWRAGAERCFFGARRSCAVEFDGSWWWTDGAAMLRCLAKPAPTTEGVLAASVAKKAVMRRVKRREVQWVQADDSIHLIPADTVTPKYGLNPRYHDLIASAVPNAKWFVPGPDVEAPFFVRAPKGKLVAVVMPARVS